mmetsp:Transcript_115476/g.326405  ORF Transcript_115476/g.326405 Transcript_115476/m.326405 type:complete len:168 (+) Transcript_115476:317-820(+)
MLTTKWIDVLAFGYQTAVVLLLASMESAQSYFRPNLYESLAEVFCACGSFPRKVCKMCHLREPSGSRSVLLQVTLRGPSVARIVVMPAAECLEVPWIGEKKTSLCTCTFHDAVWALPLMLSCSVSRCRSATYSIRKELASAVEAPYHLDPGVVANFAKFHCSLNLLT